MIRSKAVAEVKRYMGFRQDGDTDIIDWLQLGQNNLEHNWPTRPLPWFLLTERQGTSTVSEEERVAIPTGFIEEWEDDGMWVVDENGGEHLLCKYDADDLRRYQQSRTNYNTQTIIPSIPVQYALTGSYFRLFPKPQQVWTLKMISYCEDSLLDDNDDENGWLKYAPYVLIGWAGERFAAAARDGNALGVFTQMKTSAMAALDVQSMERQMVNRRMAMGETS